ncbi:uncharacterized protein KY384_008730 [Bacidia gigantensis]|uniref:uncharacterized protein n=1 Tax=Bacidia gigantensis TaxID=2732470 RepID=UPI001D0471CF|nr:uncharacterized protein KY384_008730 [Bacidia gigantensis]KAG8526530.1 hypothetical protein KY384_008730 [Bacidia gigantensis]
MSGPISALVGQPPLTADDKAIVHEWQVLFKMDKADPSKGLKVALKPPPPGTPHDSDTNSIAAGAAVSLVLMLLFTVTRLAIRLANRSLAFGGDDWAIILGLVSTPAFALFYIALAVIKISIVLFYMRLTSFTSRAWANFHRILIAFLTVCATISLFITVFECNPPIYNNVREIGRRNKAPDCMPILDLVIGFNVWHIFSDCLLLLVPFVMLWRVQMSWSTKSKVCVAGVVGFANVGLALARTIVQAMAKQTGFDLTYSATLSVKYSLAELTLGIMTANLPVLSILASKTAKKLSWAALSDEGSPDRSFDRNGHVRAKRSDHYKRQSHEKPAIDCDPRRGFRGTNLSNPGEPTVRHDVEYGASEVEEVRSNSGTKGPTQ